MLNVCISKYEYIKKIYVKKERRYPLHEMVAVQLQCLCLIPKNGRN